MSQAEFKKSLSLAIEAKYNQLISSSTKWVHKGSGFENIIITKNLHTLRTSRIGEFLASNNLTLLDIGTGTGEFLHYLHTNFSIPFENFHGISAIDERTEFKIPDSSYLIGNIENIESISLPTQKYSMIYSSHTFYHLVNPIFLLCKIYDLLKTPESEVSVSIAFIRHVPQLGLDINRLNRYFAKENLECAISKSPESPGNCNVVMVKRFGSKENLILPLRYTGEIVSASGAYVYNMLKWMRMLMLVILTILSWKFQMNSSC